MQTRIFRIPIQIRKAKPRIFGAKFAAKRRTGYMGLPFLMGAIFLLQLPRLAIRDAGAANRATTRRAVSRQQSDPRTQKRWLFIFKDLTNPTEVDRMIARF